MRVGDLETQIQNIANGGWDALDNIGDPDIQKRVALERQQTAERRQRIDSAWARFADSPEGRDALQELLDVTLNRTVYFAGLDIPLENMAKWGSFREGQNSVAHTIVRNVARGREVKEQPKPRD